MRAKHCRRCILYGLPAVLPVHLFSGITGFHRLDEQEQSQVLGEIQNTPAIGPAALACLHSRLIERGFDEAALKKVGQTLKQIISRDVRWAGPGALDPRLLLVPSRALVFNQLPHHKATKADIAAYAEWVALEKNLMFIQGVIGNMWEDKQSDKGDLREVMRITAGWRERLPGLIPMDDSKRELVPYVAISWWDSDQRIECLNLLAKTNLNQFGARLAAGLLHEIDDDDLLELLGNASLPEGALGLWFALG